MVQEGAKETVREAVQSDKQSLHILSFCQEQIRTLSSFLHPFSSQTCIVLMSLLASQPRCQSRLNREQPLRLAQEARNLADGRRPVTMPEALLSPANSASLPLLRQGRYSLLQCSGLEGVNAASIRGLIQNLATAYPLLEIWLIACQVI